MFHFHHYHKKRKDSENTRGFLMMYAILFITVVLTIAMGILDIALKQFSISSINRESSRALYAADAGLECTLYGDIYNKNFSTTTPAGVPLAVDGSGALLKSNVTLCSGNVVDLFTPNPNPGSGGTITWTENPPANGFKIKFGSGTDLVCGTVIVTKSIGANGTLLQTTVNSRGYNTDCPDNPTPARLPRVERGLKATY
ncbi:MAG: hypothetical protein NTZ13_04065 [Candidatus Parcubacteria bacterium]|nr:hypothetical protein [Candidatus Parcubacteria bacterium]